MKKNPETYRFSKGLRAFLIILCLILITTFVGGPLAYWLEDTSKMYSLYIFLGMMAIFIPLFVLAIRDLVKWEVSIWEDRVIIQNLRGVRTFYFKDVRAYKRGHNFLTIYFKSSTAKPSLKNSGMKII